MKKLISLLLIAVLVSCFTTVSFAFQPEKPLIGNEFLIEDDDSLILRNLEENYDPYGEDADGETVLFTADSYKKLICEPFIRLISAGGIAFILVFVISAIPRKQKNQ